MKIKNISKLKGNDNNITQIQNQNIIYQQPYISKSKYEPDENAIKLLKETIEDEKNNNIIYIKTLSGRTIQCGNGRYTVNSQAVGEKEMTYWEDSFNNLLKYNFIEDVGDKGEVFRISKNGYEFYDKYIGEKIEKEEKTFELNDIHVGILEMLRDNDYTLWDSQLTRFFKANIDNEIAFNELIEYGYIESGSIISADKGSDYILNSSKKKEVLKILKERKNI